MNSIHYLKTLDLMKNRYVLKLKESSSSHKDKFNMYVYDDYNNNHYYL